MAVAEDYLGSITDFACQILPEFVKEVSKL